MIKHLLPKFCGAMALTACSSAGVIVTEPESEIMLMTPEYSILENRGKTPVEIQTQENLGRYEFFRRGQQSEYLLVVFPEQASGEIKAALGAGAGGAAVASATIASVEGAYFDQLARAHRLILKGRLTDAKELVRRIDEQFEEGFGTAVLRANIAVLEGKPESARKYYEFAKGLIPESPALDAFTKGSEEAP